MFLGNGLRIKLIDAETQQSPYELELDADAVEQLIKALVNCPPDKFVSITIPVTEETD